MVDRFHFYVGSQVEQVVPRENDMRLNISSYLEGARLTSTIFVVHKNKMNAVFHSRLEMVLFYHFKWFRKWSTIVLSLTLTCSSEAPTVLITIPTYY